MNNGGAYVYGFDLKSIRLIHQCHSNRKQSVIEAIHAAHENKVFLRYS